MRVLFIGPLPEPTTGQSLACQVFLEALRREYDVDVINISKQSFKSNQKSAGRIGEVFRFAWQVWKKRRNCDAVYFTISQSVAGNLKDLLIYLVSFPRLSKMIIHLHGGPGLRDLMSDRHPVLRLLNKFFLRRIAAVVVLGRRHVSIFSAFVDPERIHVVPNFAEDGLFLDPDCVRQKFSRTNPFRFLFLSNLNTGKGHIELIEAVRSLHPEIRAMLMVDFAGGFESDADRRAFSEATRDIPEIHYHGIVQGIAKNQLFAAAHVFCLPTYYAYEGQPISILEAYASGCAVMTTDHSGIFDVFTPNVNGYVVEKQSAPSIAAAIDRAVNNPGESLACAMNNLEQANKFYRVKVYNDGLMNVVNSVIRPSGR